MKFIEENRRDTLQLGIVEDHPREYAFGDDFDGDARASLRRQPGPETDIVAEAAAERSGHSLGRSTGGNSARLQDQNFLLPPPRLIEECEGHARRLAGSRCCDEDGCSIGAEHAAHLIEHGIDWQRR